MATDWDAVIIGGGHNGLVAACYMAKAGLKVAVLERREVVGGASVTEETFPGFRISTAAMVGGLLKPKIAADLELHKFGLRPPCPLRPRCPAALPRQPLHALVRATPSRLSTSSQSSPERMARHSWTCVSAWTGSPLCSSPSN